MKTPGTEVELSEQARVRFEKLEALRSQGINPYQNGWSPSHVAEAFHRTYDSLSKEELEAAQIKGSVAGRLMAIRDFGKAAFLRLKDRSGVIQLFVQKDRVGPAVYAIYKDLDIGDIVFSEGVLFKTKTGELSIQSDTLRLLTKALRPLPEKFHGLTDVEVKYRQRYLDLIMSEHTRETFQKRSKIVEELRKFFLAHEFIEVETPMMHPVAGGAVI